MMLADFLAPFWASLFEKMGVFGLLIAAFSPIIVIGLIVVAFFLIVAIFGAIWGVYVGSYLRKAQRSEDKEDLTAAWKYRRKYLKLMKKELPAEEVFQMGMLCLKGRAADWDLTGEEASPVFWLRKAAEADHRQARFELAQLQYRENLERKPLESAKAVVRMRLLASEEYGPAVDFMEQLKQQATGRGIQQLAVLGDSGSQCKLADQLCRSDPAAALEWYLLAADAGELSAQIACGKLYFQGAPGIPKDQRKALQWYEKAAEQKDEDAAFFLGCVYSTGEGVARNYETAKKWFGVAADRGNARAAHNVAVCYVKLAEEYAQKKGLKTKEQRDDDRKYSMFIMHSIMWQGTARNLGYQEK